MKKRNSPSPRRLASGGQATPRKRINELDPLPALDDPRNTSGLARDRVRRIAN
jgi:hypothetical protein